MERIPQIVHELLKWFRAHARDLPWRRSTDPYQIWISEIMLQQTQVKTVIPYWERWMHRFPTVESLASAPPEAVLKLWEGLGYYSRARNVHRAAKWIVSRKQGCFPDTLKSVLELPGVGAYTAGAICSIAFNQPTPILDGNIIRVLTRLFAIPGNPKETAVNARLWALAETLVHAAAKIARPNICSHLNQSLMELGALVCTPKEPRCADCPVCGFCLARSQNLVADFPDLPDRCRPTARHFAAFVVRHGNRWLVRQRPASVVNAHLWEFPNLELNDAAFDPAVAATKCLGFEPDSLIPYVTIRHTITRYRITLQVLSAIEAKQHRRAGHWRTLAELDELPFPSAHRKILGLLQKGTAGAQAGSSQQFLSSTQRSPQ